MDSNEPLIEAAGIDVAFGGRTVLAAAGVRVRAGEIVTLIGPNGAGKTTMIRVVLGLIRPHGGRVRRRRGLTIGYMPQSLVADPALPLTVDRFLGLAAPGGGAAAGRRAALEEVGAAAVGDTPLADISGGELQRVMLARALIRDPDLLVLDEPAQGVDVAGQAELYRLIGRIRTARGCGVLLVSHDLHLVMAETDHVICLNRHVCCEGHPEAVARDPAYAELFGEQVAAGFAVYRHRHDHRHGAGGEIVPLGRENGSDEAGHG